MTEQHRRRDPNEVSDEHINQMRRFAGLPPFDATEMARWRSYLRWMQQRFGQRPNSDKPPQS